MTFISYTPHTWLEHTGSESDKLGWLNHAETQYDEMTALLSSLTHLERYYTKAECIAKYFSSTNKAGSVCETLDGYTYTDIMNNAIPSGVIAIWSGALNTIPAGWARCDGDNDTPNLLGKFVMCVGPASYRGKTGGISTITTVATVEIGSCTITDAQMPGHTHTIVDYHSPLSSTKNEEYYTVNGGTFYGSGQHDEIKTTGYTGSGQGHTHENSSFAGTIGQNKLPPWASYYYIMKL